MEKEFFHWEDNLSVGIQEIDEQHKLLIDLINRFFNEVLVKHNTSVANEIVTKLLQYTEIHFAVEESLFRIFNYPKYEEHKEQHKKITRQMQVFENQIELGEEVSTELFSFLRKWLKQHILQEDKQYTSFFAEKGLQADWSKKSWLGKIWD